MSRAKFLTICATCGEEVGVWNTPYNRTSSDQVVKTARHRAAGSTSWCRGSLLSIHRNVMWEKNAA